MKNKIFRLFKNISLKLKGSGLGKLPYVMDVYGAIISTISPKYVEINKIKYLLDDKDSLGLSVFGSNDETQVKLINKVIKKNWNVVDVGAHIGYYTMQYAKLVGESGKVFAFEPSRGTYKILTSNIVLNKFNNIVSENKVVSNKTKKIKFFLSKNSLTNRIVNSYVKGHSYYVQSIRLDDYLNNFKKQIHFVKIDVEGAEYEVLKGMNKILKSNKNIQLLIEFCPEHLSEYSASPSELLSFLEGHGFIFFDVSDKTGKIIKSSKEDLISNYEHGITNIFCVREKNEKN